MGNAHAAVQQALDGPRLQGERRKLSRHRGERHLFVWIDVSLFDAHVGIASEETAAEAVPILPAEITHVWVAAEGSEGPVVWISDGGPWVRRVVTRSKIRALAQPTENPQSPS
jgi:hypothetical protein